ncbi:MAG: hypothetical protein H6834_16160 [Planctomycetes bacterium]|nr:hypothetical protein [Planctomycetota bacterium]
MSMATSLPLLPAHLYEVKGGRDVDRTEALHDIERNRRFVGLGPYRLLSWEQGENLVLEHSPYWFGEDVWVDRIVYRFLDPQAAVREIRAGTLDFAPGLASRDFAPLEADAEALGLVTGQALGTGYMWIGWNCRRPGLDDPRVRLALSQAFDLQGFLHKYSTGWTMAVTGHQPPFSKAYATTITPIAFDVERTRELLAAAGYVDRDGDGWVEDPEARRLTIRFLYPTKSAGSFIAAHLAEGLKAAKVEVVHDAVEYGTYLTRRAEGNWDAIFQSWVLDRESDLYQVWHSSGAPLATRSSNYVGYANPSVDRVIEEARITLDDERRHTLWKRAEEIIYHEQPYCFLYTGASGAVWTARWRGVRMYDGRPTFRLREWFLPAE